VGKILQKKRATGVVALGSLFIDSSHSARRRLSFFIGVNDGIHFNTRFG
jgi:hypothetical protein